mgnify:CR=1 FL=1
MNSKLILTSIAVSNYTRDLITAMQKLGLASEDEELALSLLGEEILDRYFSPEYITEDDLVNTIDNIKGAKNV